MAAVASGRVEYSIRAYPYSVECQLVKSIHRTHHLVEEQCKSKRENTP